MAGISYTVNDAVVRQALQALRHKAGNLRPALRTIGEIIINQTDDAFESGKSPAGVPWKPSRRVTKQGGQTLVNTARLRNSITKDVGDDAVQVGTSVVYAAIHQLGGDIRQQGRTQVNAHRADGRFLSRAAERRRKKPVVISTAVIGPRTIHMPARPYLPDETSVNRDAILAAIARHLELY